MSVPTLSYGKNGEKEIDLEIYRSIGGKVSFIGKTISRSPDRNAYLIVDVDAVHRHGCPITRNGKKYGPCNCGAEELMNAFLAECGEPIVKKEDGK